MKVYEIRVTYRNDSQEIINLGGLISWHLEDIECKIAEATNNRENIWIKDITQNRKILLMTSKIERIEIKEVENLLTDSVVAIKTNIDLKENEIKAFSDSIAQLLKGKEEYSNEGMMCPISAEVEGNINKEIGSEDIFKVDMTVQENKVKTTYSCNLKDADGLKIIIERLVREIGLNEINVDIRGCGLMVFNMIKEFNIESVKVHAKCPSPHSGR